MVYRIIHAYDGTLHFPLFTINVVDDAYAYLELKVLVALSPSRPNNLVHQATKRQDCRPIDPLSVENARRAAHGGDAAHAKQMEVIREYPLCRLPAIVIVRLDCSTGLRLLYYV